MNPDTLFQLVQKGYRISLGAAATLIETLQNPQQRYQSFSNLSERWGEISEEWAAKGELTEQEARRFVDALLAQQTAQSYSSQQASPSTTVDNSSAATTPSPAVQVELQELTAQIATLRAEVEKLRSES